MSQKERIQEPPDMQPASNSHTPYFILQTGVIKNGTVIKGKQMFVIDFPCTLNDLVFAITEHAYQSAIMLSSKAEIDFLPNQKSHFFEPGQKQ